jgi:hypothetical protein
MDFDLLVGAALAGVSILAWRWVVLKPRRLVRQQMPSFVASASERGIDGSIAGAIHAFLGRHDLSLDDELSLVISSDDEELAEVVFLILRDLGHQLSLVEIAVLRIQWGRAFNTVQDLIEFAAWARQVLLDRHFATTRGNPSARRVSG